MGMIADLFVKLGLRSDDYNRGLNQATAQTNKFKDTLKSIGGAIAGAFAVSAITTFVREAINLAGTAEGVRSAFEKLGGMNYLGDMQKATKGTVTELQLMQNAVKASNLGLPIQTLATLFEFATARAAQTGESVDYLVESIVLGIGRKSPLILDNLGISAIALSEKMGGIAVASASVGDVAIAVGKIAEESLTKMGNTAITTTQKMAALNAQWTDIKTNFGKAIIEGGALGPVLEYINQQLWVLASNKSILNKLDLLIFGGDADKTIKQYMDQEKAVKSYYSALAKFEPKAVFKSGIPPKMLSDTEIFNKRLTDLKDKANAAKQALQFAGPKDDIAALGDAFDTANTALKNFLETTKKVKRETGSIAPMVGGKSPFKFGAGAPQSQTTVDEKTGLFTDMSSQDAAIAAGAGLDMKGITSSLAANKEQLKTALSEFISPVQEFNNQLNQLIQAGLSEAVGTFTSGLTDLFAGDISVKDFGLQLLGVIGKFMIELGTLMLMTGLGLQALQASISSMNPVPAIIGGTLLIAAGAGISALSKKGLSKSGGGGGGGGYSAASGYSGSSGMSSASNMLQGNVVFELQGTTLKGVLNNTDRKNKNIR